MPRGISLRSGKSALHTIDECMWGGNNNITEILKGRRYGGHGRVG